MKKFFSAAAIACTVALTSVSLNSCKNSDDEEPVVVNPGNVNVDPANFSATLKSGDKLVLKAGTTYYMKGAVIVNDGASIEIPAGTKIICSGGTTTYLAVAQGGKIYSNGTKEQPVVFEGATKSKADWGGIVICGKAPVNDGLGTSEVASLPYGGTAADDNSGVMTYTVINHSGARFSTTKEYNGLSLFAVGSGTKLDGIAVLNGADDGIEFFGGSVNITNLVSYNNDDDAFDWTSGWNGTATNIFAKRTAANVGNMGIEADNNKDNNDKDPRSNPTIKNATLIGYSTTDNEGAGTNLFRVGTYATIDNLVVSGWATGLTFSSASTIAWFNAGHITNVKFDNVTAKVAGLDAAAVTKMENASATGAGNGTSTPTWATGWSGL